jgi:hypothetical protein
MHAATVEVLVNKAHLEPDVAVAFAEAFDMAIANAQLVTVPVMDTRFAAVEAKMDVRFAAVDARFVALEAKMDARFEAFEARMNARFEMSEARMNQRFAEVDAKIEKRTADLVRWVFLVMLGNVALSTGATAILNFLQRAH